MSRGRGKSKAPKWGNKMPAWPLDTQPADREPKPSKPIQKKPKRPRDWREEKRIAKTADLAAEFKNLHRFQHPNHIRLLTFMDSITGAEIPPSLQVENHANGSLPPVLFPGMSGRNMQLEDRVAYNVGNTYVGVNVRSNPKQGITMYWACELTDSKAAEQFVDERPSFFVTGEGVTWLTFHKGRRRITQQLLGAIMLTNQGADVGDSEVLPTVGKREQVVQGRYRRLYKYPDASVENGSLYVQMEHRQNSVTAFQGLVADDDAHAGKLLTAREYDIFAASILDVGFISGRDPATELLIGEMVARVVSLPELLPTIIPPGPALA